MEPARQMSFYNFQISFGLIQTLAQTTVFDFEKRKLGEFQMVEGDFWVELRH